MHHRRPDRHRYERRLQEGYRTIRDRVGDPDLHFTGLTADALERWESTWRTHPPPHDAGGWDWRALAVLYLRRADAFHLAIWHGTELCGLAVGRPTAGRSAVVVEYVEGNPDPAHPLKGKISALVFAVAEVYSILLGGDRIEVLNPRPARERWLQSVGFRVARRVAGKVYWEREVKV